MLFGNILLHVRVVFTSLCCFNAVCSGNMPEFNLKTKLSLHFTLVFPKTTKVRSTFGCNGRRGRLTSTLTNPMCVLNIKKINTLKETCQYNLKEQYLFTLITRLRQIPSTSTQLQRISNQLDKPDYRMKYNKLKKKTIMNFSSIQKNQRRSLKNECE